MVFYPTLESRNPSKEVFSLPYKALSINLALRYNIVRNSYQRKFALCTSIFQMSQPLGPLVPASIANSLADARDLLTINFCPNGLTIVREKPSCFVWPNQGGWSIMVSPILVAKKWINKVPKKCSKSAEVFPYFRFCLKLIPVGKFIHLKIAQADHDLSQRCTVHIEFRMLESVLCSRWQAPTSREHHHASQPRGELVM